MYSLVPNKQGGEGWRGAGRCQDKGKDWRSLSNLINERVKINEGEGNIGNLVILVMNKKRHINV